MTIEIANQQQVLDVPEAKIRAALRHVMQEELGHEVNMSVAIVTDGRIAELNREFLNHIGPTDVLAFPFGEMQEGAESETVFGEIVISADRVVHEARRRKLDPTVELILYVVHGMLHLVGYDDESSREAKKMRRRETEILRSLSERSGKKP